MRAIRPGLLPHLVTLYNVFKSPDTGKLAYFPTFLKRTRITHSSSTVNVASVGWTKAVTAGLLVDPKTTQAYRHGTNGIKIKKRYLELPAWDALPDADKEKHWTLREGDYVVHLESNSECPAVNLAEIQARNPRKIYSIKPVLSKDGTLHHWELNLV